MSMVLTQRAEFRHVIRAKGMDGLIALLEEKAAALSLKEKQELASLAR